ncbi:MAG TPA: protein kinase, partial [Kofleriaceae bacterium]|nr:protein kinase [Kofleriaceae bacterium]
LVGGQQLGHFRVERRLGAGGMGEVYLATDLALDRPVALKVLPEALASDPKLRERLIREARAQARVVHPNVGHIYFIGEEAGRLYFAMEYVAGQTLAERVACGPLPVEDALAAIRAAVLGLREAQRSGFLHRDVKPSNLMIDAHGVLKVLDFGLAAGGPGAGGPGDEAIAPIAQTSLAGTPLYMAPEQARGDAVDLRADVYALGVTLFHLVSGRPPFVGDTPGELVTLHATAARPAVPRHGRDRAQIGAIDGLCARMMAARPEDRFASYDDLLRAIDLASAAHTRPAGFLVRALATGLDFLLVALVIGGAFALLRALGAGDREDKPLLFLGFVAYQALVVARWGRTPGKALFELEVVDTATLARPALPLAIRRALAMLGVPTLAWWAQAAAELAGLASAAELLEAVAVLAIALGPALLLHAALRVAGKRAPWDRLSGTMVRYRTPRSS